MTSWHFESQYGKIDENFQMALNKKIRREIWENFEKLFIQTLLLSNFEQFNAFFPFPRKIQKNYLKLKKKFWIFFENFEKPCQFFLKFWTSSTFWHCSNKTWRILELNQSSKYSKVFFFKIVKKFSKNYNWSKLITFLKTWSKLW